MASNIFLLSELTNSSNVQQVGMKAWNLGLLISANVPVPEGIVLTSDFFQSEGNSSEKIQQVFQQLKDIDANQFAVRSSATEEDGKNASFAGQYETVLGVKNENLEQAIEQVAHSALSNRAQTYQAEKNVKEISMAVIIQKQLNADVAGIAFTAHPLSGNDGVIVIEGGYGLGEMFVSGQVTPTYWEVEKSTGRVISFQQGSQAEKLVIEDATPIKKSLEQKEKEAVCLIDEQVNELVKLSINIEQLFGTPQDIEWAVESGKLYILQARPITTL